VRAHFTAIATASLDMLAAFAAAQDITAVGRAKVLVDNRHVRVIEMTLRPGDKRCSAAAGPRSAGAPGVRSQHG
jgi:hypothetical protein